MGGLDIGFRYLHIISAVALAGGMLFWAACLLPAMRLLDDTFHRSVLALALQRFRRIVILSTIALLASGIYNWMRLNPLYNELRSAGGAPLGQMLIGTKTLLGLAFLALVILKTLTPGNKPRQRRWLSLTLQLAAVVILLGSVLRYLRLQYLAGLAQALGS
jgi:uncharacterized membrane protein